MRRALLRSPEDVDSGAGRPSAAPELSSPPEDELRAVVFDVDFTIAKPGPDLGPEGYRRLGERFGLALDPSRYEEARTGAIAEL